MTVFQVTSTNNTDPKSIELQQDLVSDQSGGTVFPADGAVPVEAGEPDQSPVEASAAVDADSESTIEDSIHQETAEAAVLVPEAEQPEAADAPFAAQADEVAPEADDTVTEASTETAADPETETGTEAGFDAEADTATEAPVKFESLELPEELLAAIRDLGFTACTPIQGKSLPVTLDGHDVIGKAQTGTGKTAAFLITIITDLLRNPYTGTRYLGEPRALVIAPTRELVMQIAEDARGLLTHSNLGVSTLVGGIDYEKQLRQIDNHVVDIVVATPGRLLDFVRSRHLDIGGVEIMVIDEADRMLDMGFIPQVKQIVSQTPRKECRQTLLFSATFTSDIMNLAERWAIDPIRVEVAPERVATDTVDQKVYLVTTEQKYSLLYSLIQSDAGEKIIVFTNRRDQARHLADKLHRHGLDVGLLSGEISQPKRVKTLEEFKSGAIQVLVATDVAGRGLHIDDITHVVNFTLPEEAEDYVHRIGRTGRAGATGTSVSFACEDDSFLLPEIESKLGMKLPCEYPPQDLLGDVPDYVRGSRFKKEGGDNKRRGGGGNRGGRGRPPRR